jgi:hypothetical protein
VTALPLAFESVTVKTAFVVPVWPSVTATSLIERVGMPSSSVIVPIPCASAIVALPGLVRLRKNVSFASSIVSPLTRTVTVRVVWPAVKVTDPFVAW